MSQPLNFQQVILKLHEFWASQGCVIWEPYNVQVGAGTGNPATLLRVLGPEPWRVAYVEPSVRPDDGRYGENPNRMQKYYQYQVILKPEPGNPQELYIKSLEALGINPREHDIRFVEDNWESPALGAWGLGWEVWLDGQEITQYTYFQQAGGLECDPVAVEITYGVERIVLALQGKNSAWEIDWIDGLTYHDMMYNEEVEHCRYYFDIADEKALKTVYDTYEGEYKRALEGDALISAYDYVLKCSHLFNVLDTRGAIGVTERAYYFKRMRDMTRTIAKTYVAKREALGYPLMRMNPKWGEPPTPEVSEQVVYQHPPTEPKDFLLEIGVEELPAQDVDSALAHLQATASRLFDDLRLSYEAVYTFATPRRLVIHAVKLAPKQTDVQLVEKGPPVNRAFNPDGTPTKAAEGFARGKGVDVSALRKETFDGGEYVVADVHHIGKPTISVLLEALPEYIAGIKFAKTMRWNNTGVAFSRPIRWIVALYDNAIVPFTYAGVTSGNVTHGLRPYGSLPQVVNDVMDYFDAMGKQGIALNPEERREMIQAQITALADEVGGVIPDDPALMDEVVNLIERPTALRGTFEEKYLALPREVLITVMRKHQRYFPIQDKNGNLLPYFIAVRNGDTQHLDIVTHGNEHVLRARFSDANFFYTEDIKQPLTAYLSRLSTLTFQEHLGSMLDKNNRVAGMVEAIGGLLGIHATDIATAQTASAILKADLGTQMVVELTSLQGIMGREYAKLGGYPTEVANAISEHWQPRSAGDSLPASPAGALLAITDRLDSLVGLFAAGLAPKSTADPYGLRRAALGVIQILAEKGISADLRLLINRVAEAQPIGVSDDTKASVLDFIGGRLRVWLSEQGYSADIINAVLSQQTHNPYQALINVKQLTEWVKRDDWAQILDNFARCVRITRPEKDRYTVNPALFQQPEEGALYEAYQSARAGLPENGDVSAFLMAFLPLVAPISAFFGSGKGDGVLVHAEDMAVRHNRLGLLQMIADMQAGRADLSELMGF
jgi:glycyl-tRNA synthetase